MWDFSTFDSPRGNFSTTAKAGRNSHGCGRVVLLRHQLLVLNRGRERASNLWPVDRIIADFCTTFIRFCFVPLS